MGDPQLPRSRHVSQIIWQIGIHSKALIVPWHPSFVSGAFMCAGASCNQLPWRKYLQVSTSKAAEEDGQQALGVVEQRQGHSEQGTDTQEVCSVKYHRCAGIQGAQVGASRGYVKKVFVLKKEAPVHHLLLGCAPVNVFTLREHVIAVVCSKCPCDKKQNWPSSFLSREVL